MSLVNQPESRTVTIIRRIVSGVLYVPQVFFMYTIGYMLLSKHGGESGIILIFIIPLLLVITGLQIALTRGVMRKIHVGLILIIGIELVYIFAS